VYAGVLRSGGASAASAMKHPSPLSTATFRRVSDN
jgi:hypothetical protein